MGKVIIEKGDEKMKQDLRKGKDNNNNDSIGSIEHNLSSKQQGKTREIVSKKAGISRGTYERGKTIIQQKASNEIKDKAKSVKFQRILLILKILLLKIMMVKKLKILQQIL